MTTSKCKATPGDVAFLETARRERDAKALAEARRMALHHARAAGEAFAHSDPAIEATLMGLAEFFMKRALELYVDVAAGPLIRAEHYRRYRQRTSAKKSGRPKGLDLGSAWLAMEEQTRRTSRLLAIAEIHGDIAATYKNLVGTEYTVAYIAKMISKARSARKSIRP